MPTKEQARRLLVEAAYSPPDPEIPTRTARHDEVPASALGLMKAAWGACFTTRTLFARSTLSPTWKRLDPDSPIFSYVAPVVDVLRVGGLVKPLPLQTPALSSAWVRTLDQGELVAFEVVWINGAAKHARVLLRHGSSTRWVVEGVTAVRARLKVVSTA